MNDCVKLKNHEFKIIELKRTQKKSLILNLNLFNKMPHHHFLAFYGQKQYLLSILRINDDDHIQSDIFFSNYNMKTRQDEIQRKYMPQPIEQIEEDIIAINYSCHMHPITQLTIPDFMDQDKSSMIDTTCTILYAMLPMALNFFLNSASAFINIYMIGKFNDREYFSQICLGNIIANVLVYYLIEYVGAGFAIICSYFQEKQEVGYLYQKTLGISFLICVVMTPVIYLSDKILRVFGFDHHLAMNACIYAWSLVPSFYLYSFIDTNKNYLQSQGVIFPPIIIHFCIVILHLIVCISIATFTSEVTFLKVAWSKNITDTFCCLALYFYIIIKEPTKQSWVEWNIKATNNIGRFIKEVIFHEAFTYFEAIAFQIISLIACHLSYEEMAAHFSFSLMYIIIYFCFISLSQCINKVIAMSIEQNQIKICKRKISLGFMITIILAFVIIMNVIQHRQHFAGIFISDSLVTEKMTEIIDIFCIIIVVEGLNIITTGVIKTFQLQDVWKYSFFIYYIIGIGCSTILCYTYELGIRGIWIGWLVSIGISALVHLGEIICLDFEQTFNRMRERYKIIKHEIRVSKMEIAQES